VEWWAAGRSPAVALALLAFSVLAVGSGPFDTIHELSFGQRLLYWPAILALGLCLGTLVRAVLIVLIGHWPYWLLSLLCAALISAFFAPVLRFLVLCLAPDPYAAVLPPLWQIALDTFVASLWVSSLRQVITRPQTETDVARPASIPPEIPPMPGADTPMVAGPDTVASLPGMAAAEVLVAAETAAVQPEPAEVPLPGAALLARLDPADRAPLIRLSGRDHYIDVVTAAGTARLLLRFSDALALLEPEAGMQVHRSHWVAHAAVRAVVRHAGRLMLHMSDGAAVPVSRPHQEAVLAAGYTTAAKGTARARRPVNTARACGPNSVEIAGSRTDSPPV
jgi:hypothetical protein